MNIFVCLDEKGGMAFNKRRQSSDRIIRQDMLQTVGEQKLYMNSYTRKQFTEENSNIIECENGLEIAEKDDFVFIENISVCDYISTIQKIVVYRWQRAYPADTFFDIDLTSSDWVLSATEEFEGYSHECIAKEIYVKAAQTCSGFECVENEADCEYPFEMN